MHSTKSLVALLVVWLLLPVALWAQGAVGTLNGTVLDPQGAAVPGASVTATNQATGLETHATTTTAGAYTLPYLPQGTYTIRASSPGFRTSSAENVILRVAQTLTVNISLEVGQLNEQVTVSAAPPLLESGTAEIGRYISVEEYKSWPILIEDGQRQIQSFIFNSLPGTTGGTFQGSINGGQQYSHEILVEGIPVGRADLSGGNNTEFSPSAEAIGEFKLQSGAISAQYNGGQTAVANFSIKSGTNELHGSAFLYMQNEGLNALTLAAKTLGEQKPRHRENNEGYSLGGPVYIPKVYNGKHKTFFFTNLERDHYNDLVTSGFTTVTPTSFKSGDFSRLFDPNWTDVAQSGSVLDKDALGRPIRYGQIYDPSTTRRLADGTIIRDPFPGNIIPESRWDPVAKNVVKTVGLTDPKFDRMVRNIEQVGTCCPIFDLRIIGVKVDHNITDTNRFSAFYNQSSRERNNTNGGYLPVPGLPTSTWEDQTTPGRMVRASLNSTLRPNLLNRVAAGYNRFLNKITAPAATLGKDWSGLLGLQNTATGFFPEMDFAGNPEQGGTISPIGVGSYTEQPNGSYILNDDLTWVRGKHTVHFGYEYKKYYYNEKYLSTPGSFHFTPRATDLPGNQDTTGNAFASFLLGAVDSANRRVSGLTSGFSQPHHSFYLTDDFKVSPRLTINAGLRWEVIPPFYEHTGRMSYIDLSAPNPAADNRPGLLVFRNRPSTTYWKEFGPRLGFAYQVNDKLIVRGGYAMLNQPPITNAWGYSGFTYGYNATINVREGSSPTGFADDPAMYLSQPYPSLVGSLPDTNPVDTNFNAYQTTAPDANRPSYVQNYNFTIQYQLPKSVVLEAAYVGNKGTRMSGWPFAERNTLPTKLLAMGDLLRDTVGNHPEYKPYAGYPDDVSVAQALRPYPQFFSVQEFFPYDQNSNYNSLQLTATKHLTSGLSFLAAYTWSKAIGTVDSSGANGYWNNVQDYNNRSLERSITSFNYPQNFKLSWVYEPPVGKGKRFDLGLGNWALGGWQIAAIHNYRSGDPITVTQSGVNAPDGFSNGIRPDLTGQPLTLGPAPTKVDFLDGTPYINPAAFRQSPATLNGVPLRVGNAPRFIDGLRGPHSMTEQFRASKRFPIYKERLTFQLGATMTNPLNRTTRYLASTVLGDPGFGQVLQGGGGRTLQLDGRVEW